MVEGQSVESSSHRMRGLRNAGIGLALLVPGLLLFLVAREWLLATFGTPVHGADGEVVVRMPRAVSFVIGGPMALGYVIFMMGLYRAVFGARGQAMTAAWSFFRIVFGLFATISLIVVIAVLVAVIAH